MATKLVDYLLAQITVNENYCRLFCLNANKMLLLGL